MVSEINGKRPEADRTPSRSPVRKQLTVLVADDETYIVDFVSILLEDEGFRVIRAYDGEQAWRLAQSEHPDLLISDVMMPRLSGLELLHRIRSSQNGLASTPVILMSAVVRDAPTVDAAFLPKPFDIERMLDAVSDQLDIAL
jgi:DNA-binding response OmpR family regulator